MPSLNKEVRRAVRRELDERLVELQTFSVAVRQIERMGRERWTPWRARRVRRALAAAVKGLSEA